MRERFRATTGCGRGRAARASARELVIAGERAHLAAVLPLVAKGFILGDGGLGKEDVSAGEAEPERHPHSSRITTRGAGHIDPSNGVDGARDADRAAKAGLLHPGSSSRIASTTPAPALPRRTRLPETQATLGRRAWRRALAARRGRAAGAVGHQEHLPVAASSMRFTPRGLPPRVALTRSFTRGITGGDPGGDGDGVVVRAVRVGRFRRRPSGSTDMAFWLESFSQPLRARLTDAPFGPVHSPASVLAPHDTVAPAGRFEDHLFDRRGEFGFRAGTGHPFEGALAPRAFGDAVCARERSAAADFHAAPERRQGRRGVHFGRRRQADVALLVDRADRHVVLRAEAGVV